jgi:predicted nucleic acid-binding protein
MIEFKRAFLDTCVFIYLLENNKILSDKAVNFLEYSIENKVELITSTVTNMEFCVKPYQNDAYNVIEKFKELLIEFNVTMYGINLQISDLASKIRAKYRVLKGMDALQIASAKYYDCDKFVTNDKRIKSISEVDILLIDEWLIG